MKKSKVLALALVSALTVSSLASCGGNSGNNSTAGTTVAAGTDSGVASTQKKEEIKDLYTWETANREIESFNILHSQMASDFNVLTNCIDGLVSSDEYGKLVPAIASNWYTNDNGVTWTFELRNDVTWVDQQGNEKAKLTSADFLTGMEFVLNYHKNGASNTSMPIESIKGAAEYYEYTKALPEEEALALGTEKMLEMVGIAAPDDYTVQYTCVAEIPYFDSIAAYACCYPAPAALIDELGVKGFIAVSPETMWYTGPYLIESFIQGNEKVLVKNPAYYDTECSRFESVTIKMLESLDIGYQLYQTGELDEIDLTESNLRTIYEDPNHEFYNYIVEGQPKKYSYQMHLNYNKLDEAGNPDTNWNTAIANTAFRQAWYYGLNLKNYYGRTNFINPLKCENNAYTMKGLLYFSDGTEYTERVTEKLGLGEYNGETMLRYDADKFAQLKAQAMEELSAQGVTFPVQVDYYILSSSQTALDSATVLQQTFKECLGDDFVQLNIKTYVSSLTKEIITPQLQSFVINGWGADYGDPQNFLGQETYGEDTAYYSQHYSNINEASGEDLINLYKEYTELVNAASNINDDLDKRYEAYADAEVFMIQNALVIPFYYEVSWKLAKVNDFSKINAMYGISNYKYVNWETSVDAYTTEEYAALEEAWKAASK